MSHLPIDREVVSDATEVKRGLRSIGLTPEIVREIAISAVSARAESLAVDPIGAPGLLSYIHGVRAMRLQLLPLGWREDRSGNVEATVNHELGVQLFFQNVDRACAAVDPNAISGKGSAARNLVNSGQQDLFASKVTVAVLPTGKPPVVWLVCVSTNEATQTICAEVSCPKAFDGSQFEGFSKRYFVMSETLEPSFKRRGDDGGMDIDVVVKKK